VYAARNAEVNMKRIPVKDLKVNTYFDAPLYIDDEYVILSPDLPVSADLVARLRTWDYREVLTDGTESAAPQGVAAENAGAAAAGPEETSEEKEGRDRIAAFYVQLLGQTSLIYGKLVEQNALDAKAASDRVREVTDVCKASRDLLLACLVSEREVDNYVISQCAGTAVLSVAVGALLKLPTHKLIELGTAALLHKTGMTRLPAAFYNSNKVIGAPERKALAAHPVAAYRLLKSFSVNENIARAVLEHQERADGSGYPRGLKGEEISLYARVIAVTSSYVAMTSRRPYRPATDGHSAMTDLLRTRRSTYDETVLKALVYTLSVYPVGIRVLLNSGVRGIVFRANPNDARCPVVKPLLDEEGKRIGEAPLIQTSSETGVMIARVLRPDEVSSL
jgi:HD-GYP domain-containing protein (c-di-GMP phosphodiesterase class II)